MSGPRHDYLFNALFGLLICGPAVAALAWGWQWLLLYVGVALIVGL